MVPVAEGKGVGDAVGLGVIGVFVGMGRGVSVACRVGTAVTGVTVGESGVGSEVQVGGTADPESKDRTADGTRVGNSAATSWQLLKNKTNEIRITNCQPPGRKDFEFSNLFLMRLF